MAQPIHFLVLRFKDILQNTGHEAEEISFVVCDVNSEKERLQVKFFLFNKSEKILTIWRQNWLYAIEQKQRKTSNIAQI